ncbi:MAG: hypothetical protein H7A01_13945 [Hahellaceae bacterium]|nr:hypothetical protein [Hahellaceae bacterium]MCP5210158.1 hypothetical protein [Hahellaceae bacterium]
MNYYTATGLVLALLSPTAVLALEEMTDEQMGIVSAQSRYNYVFENIQFVGVAVAGEAEAGSVNTIATDGSALLRKNFSFTADSIGTFSNPFTTEALAINGTVNTIRDGNVTQGGNHLGDINMLNIGLPTKDAWENVDLQYEAFYINPDNPDPSNRNIAAGGTPSENTRFGLVTFDNLSITGNVGISGIPEGYKIESVYLDDGSRGASSREGLLLNVDIEELAIEQLLFETEEADGIFNPNKDIALNNFRLANLKMKSVTYEATDKGLRLAYHDPQPFTKDEGLLIKSGGGFPDTAHAAYNPNFPKADLTFNAHVPHSLPNESRIKGLTLDHMVLNIRNN